MAPRTSVTNSQVLQAIAELSRQVQARDEPLEARLDEMTVTLTDVVRRMDGVERVVAAALTKEAKRDTCPFRDDIVAGANNRKRIQTVEEKAHALEVKMAGGGSAGLVTVIAAGLGKLVGWW